MHQVFSNEKVTCQKNPLEERYSQDHPRTMGKRRLLVAWKKATLGEYRKMANKNKDVVQRDNEHARTTDSTFKHCSKLHTKAVGT